MKFTDTLFIVILICTLGISVSGVAQTVTLQIEPDRDDNGALTGRYAAHVQVGSAPGARHIVTRIDFPPAYTVDDGVSGIRLVDTEPGADVRTIEVDGAATPVMFAEVADAPDIRGIWIVALLKDDTADPKHVGDIIFTSRGRATAAEIKFHAETTVVKDGNLGEFSLSSDPGMAGRQVGDPMLGDLNFNDAVEPRDFGLFLEAWREFTANQQDYPLGDFHPLANSATNPAEMISEGDNAITPRDFSLFLMAWREYNEGL